MNLNKVFLVGRLTVDPQLRMTAAGKPVASFGMATNRIWVNQQGQRQEETQYHNIVVWGRQAEVANQFLKRGSMVLVEGRLNTRTWQDQSGQNRKTTEIVADKLQLGPRPGGAPSFNNRADDSQEISQAASAKEELPEINLDEGVSEKEGGEINPEEIPF